LATPPGCGADPDADGITGAAMAEAATEVGTDPVDAKPAITVTTDFGVVPAEPTAAVPASASACAVHRDAIELGLSRGRNAMAIWQDLVDTRLHRRLPERQALRAQVGRRPIQGGLRRDPDRPW
jgi:hypothetical protein